MDHRKSRTTEDEFFFRMGKASVDFIAQAIGGSGVLVYLWLCYYANINDQTCYPSIAAIARKARLGRRKVNHLLKQLETLGFEDVDKYRVEREEMDFLRPEEINLLLKH